MTEGDSVTAWELRKFLSRKTRRLQLIYRCLVLLLIVIFIGLCGHVIFYYNYLTDLQYDVLTAQGKVSGALQYRKNLLPVLIESVASFVEHEDNVFNRTVDARERELTTSERVSAELRKAARSKGQQKKEGESVGDIFQRIMAIAEQYPLLKTSEAYQLLMKQVSDAEGKIMVERAKYNDSVNMYTTAMSMFPGNVYGYIFSFPDYDYFKDRPGTEWQPIKLSRAREPVKGGN
jgi:LemA protein